MSEKREKYEAALDLGAIRDRWKRSFPNIQIGYFSGKVGYTYNLDDEYESVLTPECQEFVDEAPMMVANLVLEVEKLRGYIDQMNMADDVIYRSYKQLMAELPKCPDHGECVPFALEQIRGLMKLVEN